jgi:hypothetical protein
MAILRCRAKLNIFRRRKICIYNISKATTMESFMTDDAIRVQKQFEVMKAAFYSIESQMLDKTRILPYVRAVLTYDKELLLYLLNTIPRGQDAQFLSTFQEVYTEVYENGRVYFEKMVCPYEQFATALLYTAYH